jgi:phosphatidylglycerophosphate synthase
MLDKWVSIEFKKIIAPLATQLLKRTYTANQMTVLGFVIGILSVPFIVYGHFYWALACVLFNRGFDGLDGLMAHQSQPTQLGAYLDISLDFIFYNSIPFAFALYQPNEYGLAASFVLFSFTMTGSSFLIASIFAEKNKRQNTFYERKSFFYALGLVEATETTLFFVLILIWPQMFVPLAYGFSGLCMVTAMIRMIHQMTYLQSLK